MFLDRIDVLISPTPRSRLGPFRLAVKRLALVARTSLEPRRKRLFERLSRVEPSGLRSAEKLGVDGKMKVDLAHAGQAIMTLSFAVGMTP